VESTKAQHWIVPLFHPAVILLDAPVEESAAAMLDFMAEHFPNRTRIRIVPVAGDLPRRSIYNRESATEEVLRCRYIPRRTGKCQNWRHELFSRCCGKCQNSRLGGDEVGRSLF
jgi:hypothetical protein